MVVVLLTMVPLARADQVAPEGHEEAERVLERAVDLPARLAVLAPLPVAALDEATVQELWGGRYRSCSIDLSCRCFDPECNDAIFFVTKFNCSGQASETLAAFGLVTDLNRQFVSATTARTGDAILVRLLHGEAFVGPKPPAGLPAASEVLSNPFGVSPFE